MIGDISTVKINLLHNEFKEKVLKLDKDITKLESLIKDKDYFNASLVIDDLMNQLVVVGKSRKALFYYLKDTKRRFTTYMNEVHSNVK